MLTYLTMSTEKYPLNLIRFADVRKSQESSDFLLKHQHIMQITFNGNTVDTACITLYELLHKEGLEKKSGIAVAVNQQVVQKQKWVEYKLSANDDIIVITAAAGG